jgi:hypothetical protein
MADGQLSHHTRKVRWQGDYLVIGCGSCVPYRVSRFFFLESQSVHANTIRARWILCR